MNRMKIKIVETPQYQKYMLPKQVPLLADVDDEGRAKPLSFPYVLLYPQNYEFVIEDDEFDKLLQQ